MHKLILQISKLGYFGNLAPLICVSVCYFQQNPCITLDNIMNNGAISYKIKPITLTNATHSLPFMLKSIPEIFPINFTNM